MTNSHWGLNILDRYNEPINGEVIIASSESSSYISWDFANEAIFKAGLGLNQTIMEIQLILGGPSICCHIIYDNGEHLVINEFIIKKIGLYYTIDIELLHIPIHQYETYINSVIVNGKESPSIEKISTPSYHGFNWIAMIALKEPVCIRFNVIEIREHCRCVLYINPEINLTTLQGTWDVRDGILVITTGE